MRFSLKAVVLTVAVVTAPLSLSAQSTPTPTPAPVNAVTTNDSTPVGPSIASSSVAYHPAASTDSLSLEPQRRRSQGMGQAAALMIAGGAGVVVGLIIGDDVGTLIAVGGAVVGLYGLYLYMK